MKLKKWRVLNKPLCDKCNLDGNCCCQENQKDVESCGMEEVLAYNKEYNRCMKAGRTERDPDTGELLFISRRTGRK